MLVYANKLLEWDGWHDNRLITCSEGIITDVSDARDAGTGADLKAEIVAPGFFDIHAHGGEGFYPGCYDFERLSGYLERLASCGVTDLLMTVAPADGEDEYRRILSFIHDAMDRQANGSLGGAYIQGVHLEGPFLNPNRCGAMDPARMPAASPETYDRWFGTFGDIVRLVTIAPEMPGARELAAHLLKKGIRVQAGHTDATAEQADEAFSWGINSLCHTFNAARPIHHRNPGIVTAALLDPSVYCEAICDLKHLAAHTLKLIYRMKGPDRMMVISDSGVVTGLADGEYIIDGRKYCVQDGTQRVKGGQTLSGGACYVDGGVRNLVSIGIPVEDALYMASRTPADRIGLPDIGKIAPGQRAHIAGFDRALTPLFSVIGGWRS